MSVLIIFVAPMALAASQSASGALNAAPPERCDYIDKRTWKERSQDPRAGVVLLPNFVSAMPRSKVKAISPLLVSGRPRGPIELSPGLTGRATAHFANKTDALSSLYLEGGNEDVALNASTAYFGEPHATRPLGSFIDKPAHITGGFGYEKRDEYLWCDQDRLVALVIKDRAYTVVIEPR